LKKLLIIFLCLTFGFIAAKAQTEAVSGNLRHEFQFSNANDAYLWKSTDRYYTNGLRLDYRRTLDASKGLGKLLSEAGLDPQNFLVGMKLGQDIYTPRSTIWVRTKNYDRPYAGWLFTGGYLNYNISKSALMHFDMEVGVTGEWSKAKELQQLWHKAFQFDEPLGWDHQISNRVGTNILIRFTKEILYTRNFSLLTESMAQTGCMFRSLSQDATIRIGKLNRLSNSSYRNLKLLDKQHKREWFLFAGLGARYSFHNTFIEGSRSRDEFTTTKGMIPFKVITSYGINYAFPRCNISYSVTELSPEVVGGLRHRFGLVAFNYRF
jgi:lipid A 3-O-deacylase